MIEKVAPIATAQISISAITTAILCPIAVILIDRYQKSKGIYGTKEYVTQSTQIHPNAEIKSHFYESASYKEEDRP